VRGSLDLALVFLLDRQLFEFDLDDLVAESTLYRSTVDEPFNLVRLEVGVEGRSTSEARKDRLESLGISSGRVRLTPTLSFLLLACRRRLWRLS